MESTPARYSSPEGSNRDAHDRTPPSRDRLQNQSLSIRRGRPSSRSRSRSPLNSSPSSPSSKKRYRSTSSSRSSRPQTRSRSLSSRSRSRSPDSYSRSRSISPSRSRPPILPDYRPHLTLKGHTAAVSQVRISPDGKWIASASADGTAKIWNASTGAILDTLVGHMAGVSCLAWAPDSNTLATGSDDKAIRLWDRITGSPAHAVGGGGRGTTRGGPTGKGPLLGHHNYIYSLAFSPKGNILASGSYDEAVFLWDVRAGRLMRSLPAHSDPVSGIGFCRDGTLVVSCSTDGLIRIWDTSTGQCLRTLVHEDNPAVTNVCFSPNGLFVLAFNLDNSLRLWDYVKGSVKKTYQGHKNEGFSIGGGFGVLTDADDGYKVEEDGDHKIRSRPFIVSASEDGDIVIWDVVKKDIIQRITQAHKGVCFWVDVNGGTMASCGQDNVVRLFRHRPSHRIKREPNGVSGLIEHAGNEDSPDIDMVDVELQQQIEAEAEAASPGQNVKEEEL
ncbi:WD40-repeat-containing domain protein [Podospora fimiseda]|uniref:Mitochondrial division protein 1 n=1 Tax=Podospora fimiseda TaxID=252190 RepID=A0AAN7BY91_9PEZI|nr:WD40-repeat-containing domain protein [Podospora fimiseda]